jgi:hypothetical protein
MIDAVIKLGVSGSVGLFIGLLVNFLVEPVTVEGTGLILFFFVLVTIIIGMVYNVLRKPQPKKEESPEKIKQKNKIWLPGDD